MQKETKTMGAFVAPSRNAPLVCASFRIAHNYGSTQINHLQKLTMLLSLHSI